MANHAFDPQPHHEAVLELMRHFASFGLNAQNGIDRLAASAADKQARDFLCDWFKDKGFEVRIDGAGNIFGVLSLDKAQAAKNFLCGSHLDSQPNGGQFDGTLGVAYACVAALLVQNKVELGALNSAFSHFIVCCWTSEEGARFQPSLLGSRYFTSALNDNDLEHIVDADGISIHQALKQIGYLGKDRAPQAHQYFEVHIEQGPKLEKTGIPIALVTACWGARKFEIEIKGRPDHTGPTPMHLRQDGLLAAAKLIVAVNEIVSQSRAQMHSSVGRIVVEPNSPNTVAENVRIWVEFRSDDAQSLHKAEAELENAMQQISLQTSCTFDIAQREIREVMSFDATASETITNGWQKSQIDHLELTTIAGHDAVQLQSTCPSSLLFVPSRNGKTHSPEEYTSEKDICAGFDASLTAICALIESGASPELGNAA